MATSWALWPLLIGVALGVPAFVFGAALKGILWPTVVAPIAGGLYWVLRYLDTPSSNDTRDAALYLAVLFLCGYLLAGGLGFVLRALWPAFVRSRQRPDSNGA